MALDLSNVGGTYWASAVIDTKDASPAQPVVPNSFGVASVTRVDAGAYDVTLINELSPNECVGFAFNMGTGDPTLVTIVHIDNRIKRLFVYDTFGSIDTGLLSINFFQLIKTSDVVEYYTPPAPQGQ